MNAYIKDKDFVKYLHKMKNKEQSNEQRQELGNEQRLVNKVYLHFDIRSISILLIIILKKSMGRVKR